MAINKALSFWSAVSKRWCWLWWRWYSGLFCNHLPTAGIWYWCTHANTSAFSGHENHCSRHISSLCQGPVRQMISHYLLPTHEGTLEIFEALLEKISGKMWAACWEQIEQDGYQVQRRELTKWETISSTNNSDLSPWEHYSHHWTEVKKRGLLTL